MSKLHDFMTRGLAAQAAVDKAQLLAVLHEGTEPRDVYKAQDGTYRITYWGGAITAETVRDAVSSGAISETYPATIWNAGGSRNWSEFGPQSGASLDICYQREARISVVIRAAI